MDRRMGAVGVRMYVSYVSYVRMDVWTDRTGEWIGRVGVRVDVWGRMDVCMDGSMDGCIYG